MNGYTMSLMKRPSLLVALADESQAKHFRGVLFYCGYEVETATRSRECLAKLCQFVPDVLVLDRALPGAGGARILARIRENGQTSELSVVLATGEVPADVPPSLLEPPVVHCLQKPFTPAALLDTIWSLGGLR